LPHDFAVTRDGKRIKVPRYYFEKFSNEADPFAVEAIRDTNLT